MREEPHVPPILLSASSTVSEMAGSNCRYVLAAAMPYQPAPITITDGAVEEEEGATTVVASLGEAPRIEQ